MPKVVFERVLFASRWLLAPFFLALAVALAALIVKVGVRAYDLAARLLAMTEEEVILSALDVVDLTLGACLIVLVVFSTYANFVSRVEPNKNWPSWMAAIDYGELKLKLIASIVAIAAIKLLEAFMEVDHQSDRALGWRAGLFGVFVMAALLLGIAEWLGRGHDEEAE